jgi:hypothetical protein
MMSSAVARSGSSDSRKSFKVSISSCRLTPARRPRFISSRETTPKSWRISRSRSSSAMNGFSTSAVKILRSS